MTVAEQIPVEAFDDETARTPHWETLLKQAGDQKVNVIPRGTYEATLVEVNVVRRRDTGAWTLRMMAVTIGLGRYLLSWRGLAEEGQDPFALTDTQVKALRRFAVSMGVPVPAPAETIVAGLRGLLGDQVEAKVVHTPIGPQTTLSRATDPTEVLSSTSRVIVVNGQAVNGDGEVTEGAAAAAFLAHSKVLNGLRAAHMGFMTAAEGAYELRLTQGWLALGYESILEYLASPEITQSKSDFYRLADIWESYVLDGEVDPARLIGAGSSKLEVPLPALKLGVVSAERAAADAESLTRKELRDRYRELLGGDEADPEPEPEPSNPKPNLTVIEDGGEESRRRDDGFFDPAEVPGLRAEIEQLQVELERATALELPADLEVVLAAAKTVTVTLRRVLVEIGDPKQKRMGKDLRAAVLAALDEAHEHGLDVEGES